ncbi:MAG: chitobiase/beta-hexosaminidase C-terminal domain-containing protein [Muribaculaceae bacterium]|nr:chitobiase/beta-hexosaminidase C-terminal domain-containing protein [Muribaculaceae bacterium]
MKKFFSLLMMALLTTVMWAGEVTFDASVDKSGNTTAGAQTLTKEGITINLTNGTLNDAQYRCYANASWTISSSVGNITKIVFTCTASGTTKYGPGCQKTDAGYTYSGTTGTWEGDASEVTFTSTGSQVRATKIVVTYTEAQEGDVVAPVITLDPADGPYYEGSTVTATLTCETEGAAIQYALNDGDFQAYTDPVALTETTKISAKAVLGDKESSVVSKTVTFKEAAKTIATIAELKELGKGTEFTYTGNAVVTYFNSTYNNYLWVKDETGATLIYQSGKTFPQGTVLASGWSGKIDVYKGLTEIVSVAGLEATEDTQTITPKEITTDDVTAANQAVFAVIRGATISGVSGMNFKINETVAGYKRYSSVTIPTDVEGKTFDITGIISVFNNPQFIPTEIVEVVEEKPVVITFDPAAGTYTGKQTVKINVENTVGDYIISYKINDGQEQDYDEQAGIEVAESLTITAYVLDSRENEEVFEASAAYVIEAPKPINITFDPAAGTYTEAQIVKINVENLPEGAVLKYSLIDSEEEEFIVNNETYSENGVNVEVSAVLMANVYDAAGTLIKYDEAEYVIEKKEPVVLDGMIVFNDLDAAQDGSAVLSATKILDKIEKGAEYVSNVTESAYVYDGLNGLKFSSSSKNGNVTFALTNKWLAKKVTVIARNWKESETATLTINGGEAQQLATDWAVYTLDLGENGEEISEIKLNVTKRAYVKVINIEGEEIIPTPVITVTPDFGEYEGTQVVTVAVENKPVDSKLYYTFVEAEAEANAMLNADDEIEYNEETGIEVSKSGLLTIILRNVAGEELASIEGNYTIKNTSTAVEGINAGKAMKSVRYINVAGQQSNTAFTGVNIVVVNYEDGTKAITKVVK